MKQFILTLRKLRKNQTANSLGIASLIVGLVCVIYIFIWVVDEIGYDRFHTNVDRIFGVHAFIKGVSDNCDFRCPPAVGPALKTDYPEVENSCRYMPPFQDFLVSYKNQKFFEHIAMADFSLFDMFSFPFIQGGKGEDNLPNKIVLTESAARRYFGDENAVGKVVLIDNETSYTVSGVIRDIPFNSSIQFSGVTPLDMMNIITNNPNFLNTWDNNCFVTYGLLGNSREYKKIASEITKRIQKEIPESTSFLKAYQFKDKYLYAQNHIRNIRIFALIGLLVLITAILNFINLSTARSQKSAKESSLRKIAGASNGRLIRHIFTEISIICLMAFLAAIVLAFIGLPFFNQLVEKNIRFSILFSFTPLLAMVLIYTFTVLLSGSYPAFLFSSFSPHQSLIHNSQSVIGKKRFRNALIIIQFIVSMILLSSTLIIGRQTRFMEKMDIGLAKNELINIQLNGQLKKQYQVLKEEISRLPGVASASVVSSIPTQMYSGSSDRWNWDGKKPDFKPLVTHWYTDEDLLKTFQITLTQGSLFSRNPKEILINQRFADLLGWKQSDGKILNHNGTNYQVKGIIKNFNFSSLYQSIESMVIFPVNNESWAWNFLAIRVSPTNVSQTLEHIKNICTKLEPKYPVNYSFMNDEYNTLIKSELNLTLLMTIFSVFAIIVLSLGLLGFIMFLAEQKTKEIGIRKYLGEEIQSITRHFMKPFLLSGIIASMVSIPITWYFMKKWLQSYTYRIDLDIWLFIQAGSLVICIALASVAWHSWRAANQNPVEALRYE